MVVSFEGTSRLVSECVVSSEFVMSLSIDGRPAVNGDRESDR